MSVTSVQVHLPSSSHSFQVIIPSEATILDFKLAINKICTGNPRTSGQRIIYRGRVLNDGEIVGQIWTATDEPHTCHLAVHPSAWSSTPPNITDFAREEPITRLTPSTTPISRTRPAVGNMPLTGALPPQLQSQANTTFSYIQYMHTNALSILARQPCLPWPGPDHIDNARGAARQAVELSGRGWPSYLNQDFPVHNAETSLEEGVRYASTYIDNLPYLSLLTPDAAPTPLQAQAIRVLSYTFPLLCVYPTPQGQYSNPLQVNAFPPRPVAPLGLPAQGGLPQIPIRPLIIPLILLTLRTSLLLYFFQPARKPLFGFMLLIWVVWEVAGAIRGALGGENDHANRGLNNRGEQAGNGNAGAAGIPAGGAPGVEARRGNIDNALPHALPNSQEAILNHLAQLNLSAEAPFVEPNAAAPNPNAPAPSLAHKLKTFSALLLLTLHPAVWDRRRAALRAREGRVREDARTREARALQRDRERTQREENRRNGIQSEDVAANTPEPSLTAPKPFWVAEYIQRVRSGDWVDD